MPVFQTRGCRQPAHYHTDLKEMPLLEKTRVITVTLGFTATIQGLRNIALEAHRSVSADRECKRRSHITVATGYLTLGGHPKAANEGQLKTGQ